MFAKEHLEACRICTSTPRRFWKWTYSCLCAWKSFGGNRWEFCSPSIRTPETSCEQVELGSRIVPGAHAISCTSSSLNRSIQDWFIGRLELVNSWEIVLWRDLLLVTFQLVHIVVVPTCILYSETESLRIIKSLNVNKNYWIKIILQVNDFLLWCIFQVFKVIYERWFYMNMRTYVMRD